MCFRRHVEKKRPRDRPPTCSPAIRIAFFQKSLRAITYVAIADVEPVHVLDHAAPPAMHTRRFSFVAPAP